MTPKHLICVGLIALTAAAMWRVCPCDFVALDDNMYVTKNPRVLEGLTPENVHWAFTDSCAHSGFFYPMIWLSLQLDATLFGPGGAWGFHLVNLLLHTASVVLFFLILEHTTADLWRSAVTAALFAIHPLRVESVAWITERKDVLGMLFLLLTVAAYVWYAERPSWRRYAAVAGLFLLGLTAKIILITLPFGLLLLDYWPLYRLRLGQTIPAAHAARVVAFSWQRLVLEKVPLLLIAIGMGLFDMHLLRNLESVSALPLSQRVELALSGYLSYLEMTIWPTNLAVLYPVNPVALWHVLLSVAVLGAISAAVFRWRRDFPFLIVGWLWFLGTLVPLSGIIHIGLQSRADRFAYIPHLGLLAAVVWGVGSLKVWRNLSTITRTALVGLVLLALGTLTWIQTCYWQNSELLFTHALEVTENNHIIYAALGGYFQGQGKSELAESYILEALKIRPDKDEYNLYYGMALLHRGALEEALQQMQHSVSARPKNPDAHYLLALTMAKLGNLPDARRHLLEAFRLWDANPTKMSLTLDSTANKVAAHMLLGGLQLRDGASQKAIDHFAAAIRLEPNLQSGYEWLGIALGRVGRWGDAEATLRQSLRLDPDNATSRGYLAFALARQGQPDAAGREYAAILQRAPSWAENACAAAMDLITLEKSVDVSRARELAQQACEATEFKQPRFLETLAATQAAGGDFAQARATAQQALSLTSDAVLISKLQEKISRYEQSLRGVKNGD